MPSDAERLALIEQGSTAQRAAAIEAALSSGDGEWLKRIHDGWDSKAFADTAGELAKKTFGAGQSDTETGA